MTTRQIFTCILYFGIIISVSCNDLTVNIALNQTNISVSSTSTYEKHNAVDGRFHTGVCFETEINSVSNQWWMITFSKHYFVRSIRILNSQQNANMKNVVFLTSTYSTFDPEHQKYLFTVCNVITKFIDLFESVTKNCLKGPLYSKSVVVKNRNDNSTLTICEIEIWTLRGIDRNIQTVNGMGDNIQSANNDQSKADWIGQLCTWSGRVEPTWWMIDLQKQSEIYAVSLINRVGVLDCLGYLKIIVSNNSADPPPWTPEKKCGSIEAGSFYTTRRCPQNTFGQYLAVFKDVGASELGLTICEIDIFGSSINSSVSVNWVIKSINSINQPKEKIASCNVKDSESIDVSENRKEKIVAELKGVSIISSCKQQAFTLIALSNHDIEDCQLINTANGYYTEVDMLDTCFFECNCKPGYCLRIYLKIFTSKLLSLNRDFFIIVNV
ncbi:unnamed protein product [Dimorphilus gyrociliatus]|uniref:Uncharacterized protein n=1 Tax=Dimorphilus gyrociliatus TaxID=2664684 RepID=A0A7I8WF08_9ANNE|nr:unnamed protein product [Dimorphilus gyrociliatus]